MHASSPYAASSGLAASHAATRSRWVWLTLLFAAALWFAILGSRRLANPDEGRYAEIAREMLVSGDWVTPRLNGIKYFEKPPLQYWMTATAYQVFGVNEFAARFWTALTGFAGIVLAGWVGTRLFSRTAGAMAASITASSLLYLVIGHLNTLDMGLSFFLQLSVCSFLLAQRGALHSSSERNWMLLAWAAAALAFLSKGLIALVLPALTLMVYSAVTRDVSAWKRLHFIKGLALFLLLTLPWLIAVARANPEFLHFFFIHEQFQRFASNVHDRDGPWWYFLPIFLLGSLPWTLVALRQLKTSWRMDASHANARQRGLQTRRFLMLWIAVVVGFFSLSHSKLPPYILPAMPMFALLLGDMLTQLQAGALRRHLLVTGGLLTALSLVLALLPDTIAGPRLIAVVKDIHPEASLGFLIVALAMLCPWWFWRQAPTHKLVFATGLGSLLGMTVLLHSSNALDRTRSGFPLVAPIAAHLTTRTHVYSVGDYDQTLPFYLKRQLTLVNYRGELDFGLRQEPELAIDSLEAFARAWRADTDAIAVMPPVFYNELLRQGLPMHVLTQQYKLIAVRKP